MLRKYIISFLNALVDDKLQTLESSSFQVTIMLVKEVFLLADSIVGG